jgi:hypothetical protein
LSGHCLWTNPANDELELGGACNGSITAEEFFGYGEDSSGGWQFTSVWGAEYGDGGHGGALGIDASDSCGGFGQDISLQPNPPCGDAFYFPSTD